MLEKPITTVLFEAHQRAGARLIEFGGWMMPVQYAGIVEEHLAVRNAVGVFDISHMGQVRVEGAQAAAWLDEILTNRASKLSPGTGHYSFLLNKQGGVIDDLFVYRLPAGSFLLVINASKSPEDIAWMEQHLAEGVELTPLLDQVAGLAVQGPEAVSLFSQIFEGALLPPRNGIVTLSYQGAEVHAARTGYTGEDGFELFLPAPMAEGLWNRILALGCKPCGLGSRDTLRLEVCYPLNGSDLSATRTPLEAGLGFAVDLTKPSFIGRSALLAQKAVGISTRLAAFRMTEKCPPPRSHYPVLSDGKVVSEISSGTLSPCLNTGIGMAYLPAAIAKPGTLLEIDIRGRTFSAIVESKPLYKKSNHANT